MGNRGPLKKLAGAQGHRQHQKVTLLATRRVEPPDSPDGLLASTKGLWDEFWASDVAAAIQPVDVDALTRFVRYRDEWQRSMNAYVKTRIVAGSKGQPTLSPYFEAAMKLETAMGKLSEHLGLSPLARMRLGIAFGQVSKTIEDLSRDDALDDEDSADPRYGALYISPLRRPTLPQASGGAGV